MTIVSSNLNYHINKAWYAVWPRNDDSEIENIYILDLQPPLQRINEVGQYVIDIDQ